MNKKELTEKINALNIQGLDFPADTEVNNSVLKGILALNDAKVKAEGDLLSERQLKETAISERDTAISAKETAEQAKKDAEDLLQEQNEHIAAESAAVVTSKLIVTHKKQQYEVQGKADHKVIIGGEQIRLGDLKELPKVVASLIKMESPLLVLLEEKED